MTVTIAKIQLRRDTAANWTSANPTLAEAEFGFETDTQRAKYGDGATPWNSLSYQGGFAVTGSSASPSLITALGGVTISGYQRGFMFVKGSGGAVVVTASPRVSAGTIAGQELLLTGTDDTATVSLGNGNGLVLNGLCVLRNGSTLSLIWDGSNWREVSRNDI